MISLILSWNQPGIYFDMTCPLFFCAVWKPKSKYIVYTDELLETYFSCAPKNLPAF